MGWSGKPQVWPWIQQHPCRGQCSAWQTAILPCPTCRQMPGHSPLITYPDPFRNPLLAEAQVGSGRPLPNACPPCLAASSSEPWWRPTVRGRANGQGQAVNRCRQAMVGESCLWDGWKNAGRMHGRRNTCLEREPLAQPLLTLLRHCQLIVAEQNPALVPRRHTAAPPATKYAIAQSMCCVGPQRPREAG